MNTNLLHEQFSHYSSWTVQEQKFMNSLIIMQYHEKPCSRHIMMIWRKYKYSNFNVRGINGETKRRDVLDYLKAIAW